MMMMWWIIAFSTSMKNIKVFLLLERFPLVYCIKFGKKAADAAILTLWPERLKCVTENRSICGFLVEEVIKAIVHRDGIIGKYPKEERSIARHNFKPRSETTAFRKALSECTEQSWVLLDPDIYNYGGVDMILITDKDIVGINVTIASTHSLMSPFFDVWRPIAGTKFKTSGIFIAPDGFAHTEAGVGIVWLKNVYNELWMAIRRRDLIPDHSCTCKGGCKDNRCKCKKLSKICSSNCKCTSCQNKQ
ncbi:hypothetical protein F443_04739 [Phytophthora nicotianae P1569]|uniref:CRC domain-containing protein n=1 Tax=Phytophthora nicotianae P1569 TaxID=1317065 RepID=V9FKR9_PHYNI|nr:hypothetical protein F443_04739 [Phytophthora nicotianae P1569]